jgi:hypothetical protein
MIPIKKENKTIVRIWKSNFFQGCVGHVSVETNEYYMSFWPVGKCGKNLNLRASTKEAKY